MTPTLVSAIGSAVAVVIGAAVAGVLQLRHNRAYHGTTPSASAGDGGSPPPRVPSPRRPS